ncbi:7TM diverse intracellular signaling domain-containing protein [Fulvivirgaceae bacterium BMA10]|uniref:7TM diverse intracellular signaling domain-containing protein n=1 Tax=Splendidivirga corallicola TaxID=3051826 RepID=A0ABT8KR63_9BACT|nr:7TM diverse intracellular signaling domain-containing protein [Fulvivirgaceae bacterium BMA10]
MKLKTTLTRFELGIHHKSIFILCCILFAGLGSAFAVNEVTIHDSLRQHIFNYEEIQYFEDKSNSLTIDQIISKEYRDLFIPSRYYAPQNVNVESTYWYRIKIRHLPNTKKNFLIEFFDSHFDEMSAYIPDGKGGFRVESMGDMRPFKERKFQHINFEIMLSNELDGVYTYYFKIKSHDEVNVIIVLRSLEFFVGYALTEYLLFGVFFGMIIILSLYNFLMYLAIREWQYITYIFYVLSMGMYTASYNHIALQYIWPNQPEWEQIAYGFALYSTSVFALLFARQFLHVKNYSLTLNRLITYLLIIRTIFFLAALFINHDWFVYRMVEVVPLMLIYFISIYVWAKGFRPARFFVLAYTILFAGFILTAMGSFIMTESAIFFYYSVNISFVVEMLFLSFALGDKVSILKAEKDKSTRKAINQLKEKEQMQQKLVEQLQENEKLKDKVNQELEGLVEKRTREINEQKHTIELKNEQLREVNERLIQKREKINRMNALLDMDNWKLKKNIKEVLIDRVVVKNIDYEEYKNIFPGELDCFRYIDNLKWSNGYACKKCNNDKYFKGAKKFSRRCTKCGYNESVTAFTIFQGIKFPINKAFYIAYLVVSEKDNHTLDDLSIMLNLRKATCWSFRNRVKEIYESIKTKKSGHYLLDLDHIILADYLEKV